MENKPQHHYWISRLKWTANRTLASGILALTFLAMLSRCVGTSTMWAQPNGRKAPEGSTQQSTPASTGSIDQPAAEPGSASRFTTIDDLFLQVAGTVPQFGGMYFAQDGTLQAYLTDTSASVVEAARRAVEQVFGPEKIRKGGFHPIQGQYGFRELHALHLRARAMLAMPGVVSLDTDERTNRLAIGLSRKESQGEVERQLAALRIPLDVISFRSETPARMLSICGGISGNCAPDPTDRTRPLAGGTQITINGGGFCTISFLARLAGVNGFVTCDHCTAVRGAVDGSLYDQPAVGNSPPSNRVGVETIDPPFFSGGGCPAGRMCRFSDSAFAAIWNTLGLAPPVTGRVGQVIHPDPDFPSNFSIKGLATPLSGENVFKVGRTTGMTLGSVDGTCEDINQADSQGNDSGITMLCQNTANAFVAPGDSGSPVLAYIDKNDPYSVNLVGVLWGKHSSPLDNDFNYSPIGNVLQELGPLGVTDFDEPPTVQITNPPNQEGVPYGGFTNVTFSASVGDFEAGPNCCAVTWESDKDGFMGTGTSVQYEFHTPGERTITATAQELGFKSNKAQASIKVHTTNTPPKVWILRPTQGQTLYRGSTYVLQGSSFDSELFGPLPCNQLAWSSAPVGSQLLALLGSGCNVEASFSSTGHQTIFVTGTDLEGAPGTDSVSLDVIDAPPNSAPIVTILNPIDGNILEPNVAVSLKGIAKDPAGKSPISYQWVLGTGPGKVVLGNAAGPSGQPMTLPWTPSSKSTGCGPSKEIISLFCTNVDGSTGSASVSFYVNHPTC